MLNIAVCIKQVPDTTAAGNATLDPVTGRLMRELLPTIMNYDDKSGLECAIRIKEKYAKDAHITIVSMGPPNAKEVIVEGIAMGADDGYLITYRAFGGADTLATSLTVAKGIEKIEKETGKKFDLIITGRQAIDGDTAQVGPEIAEHLNLNNISYAEGLEDLDTKAMTITIKRQFEDRYHIIKMKLPCLITAIQELADPRYMTVGKIFDVWDDADKIHTITRADMGDLVKDENLGLNGSPTNVARSFPKQLKGEGKKFEGSTEDEVTFIMDALKAKFVI
jgi:electron transfer flavoprotein beta subunit